MLSLVLLMTALPPAISKPAQEKVQTLFVKVGPMPGVAGRSPNQDRAVVLIHGLTLHMISNERAFRAYLRNWQQSDHALVRRLALDSDVYSLAYGQNQCVESIASSPEILSRLRTLKAMGYREIVLVGHSAGGLIARQLVEDHPRLGVTRVIQVCSPNTGSGWAALKTTRAAQIPFLVSLTRTSREKVCEARYPEKRIPDSVAFACVIGSSHLPGDGVVSTKSQWSSDLQGQGIPAYSCRMTHWDAMTNSRIQELLARLIVEPMPRWDEAKVSETRKTLIGD